MATLGAGLATSALLPRLRRRVAWSVAGVVGLSRLVPGVPWPSDVLAGWAFAAAVLTTAHRTSFVPGGQRGRTGRC
ncbi:phosphatase PAP2 family protein [Amycolatopsis sp. FDAARGOS 1241]|nr:phosphatase PAP2 family protein [Amycolatopsis sp. FDAARGOS 1241]